MGRAKSQLRYCGYWLDGPAPMNHPAELTVAARRLAMSALEDLNRLGITVELDKAGRAHFRSVRIPSRDARLAIERQGDLIETYLIERAIAAFKREQESGG